MAEVEVAGAAPTTEVIPPTETILTGATPAESATVGTEAKTGEGQTEKTDAKPVGVPEEYEFKMPEGLALDSAAVEKFEPIFKEMKLSQDQAQVLAERYAEHVQGIQKAQADAHRQQVEGWVSNVKADPEIGGKAMEENVIFAKKALGKYGTPELTAILDQTGFGNHPELVRAFCRIGKAMSEPTTIYTGGTANEQTPVEKIMYPTMNK